MEAGPGEGEDGKNKKKQKQKDIVKRSPERNEEDEEEVTQWNAAKVQAFVRKHPGLAVFELGKLFVEKVWIILIIFHIDDVFIP